MLSGKSKVRRGVIESMIASGQITAKTADGEEILDFRALFEKFNPGVMPRTDSQRRRCLKPRHLFTVKIDDTFYSESQLEHFGDAVISIASRVLCHELFGKYLPSYFQKSSLMISNRNLATSEMAATANQFEARVGKEFVEQGPVKAIELAKTMLKSTAEYLDARKLAYGADK